MSQRSQLTNAWSVSHHPLYSPDVALADFFVRGLHQASKRPDDDYLSTQEEAINLLMY